MSDELREYKIGCNTLWPRTATATVAVKHVLGGESVIRMCRTTELMADAAYTIVTSKSEDTNGNFFIDDEVMASIGVKDFSKYKMNQQVSDFDLIHDFMC